MDVTKKNRNRVTVMIGLSFLGLSGCVNQDVSDLMGYIQEVKSRPKGVIQPLPEMKMVEPFFYSVEDMRDPFQQVERVEQEALISAFSGTGIMPDTSRRKEELESYPLDSLQMVGTLIMEENLWGLIKASDGTIHRIQKGNHIGRDYGEVIRVSDSRVELMEIVSDKPGLWVEQPAVLQLID